MAIGTRYQGQPPPENTRTKKAKQSESTSSSSGSAEGKKRNRADQQGSDTSDSRESDSPPPKKKSHGAEKSRKRGRRKIPHEVIDLDDVENLASADSWEGAHQVIELLDSDSEGNKREKGKQRREKKGTDNQVTSHA